MDPLTLALLAGGGTLVGSLPDIIPSKYERNQKKELEKLQRQQEMGQLGLTDRERQALQNQMQGQIDQSNQYAAAERARLSSPQVNPQAMLQAQMAQESSNRQMADAAKQLENINLQKQQQQEQYIRDLQASQGEYARKRAEALVAPVTAGAQTAIGTQMPQQIMGGAYVTPQTYSAIQSNYGLTTDQMQQLTPMFQRNPDMLQMLMLMGGK